MFCFLRYSSCFSGFADYRSYVYLFLDYVIYSNGKTNKTKIEKRRKIDILVIFSFFFVVFFFNLYSFTLD